MKHFLQDATQVYCRPFPEGRFDARALSYGPSGVLSDAPAFDTFWTASIRTGQARRIDVGRLCSFDAVNYAAQCVEFSLISLEPCKAPEHGPGFYCSGFRHVIVSHRIPVP